MEDFKELIATAVEEGVARALENSNIIVNDVNLDELLTAEQVHKEYGIGVNSVRKMFADKELAVQRYTTPFKVTRRAVNDYLSKSHDYLSERSWETNENNR